MSKTKTNRYPSALMRDRWVKFAAAATAAIGFVATASATECIADAYTNRSWQVGSKDSRPVTTRWASGTWEDWIWRGPIKRCTASWGNNCTYTWTQSNTKGYSWELGGGIDAKGIPVVKGALSLLGINGNYGRTKTWTESFGWGQTFNGNVYVQPVQVVERRWIGGQFEGTFWRTGSSCKQLVWGGTAWTNWNGAHHWWDNGYRWGEWSTNAEQKRYGKYHWWWA